ncbi:MAG: nucleoside phosphorylase [Leeuwenhoekiella sp.]
MPFAPSELIINPDGSIYHLGLRPGQIASTIITVGDPDRVDTVASYFDNIEFTLQQREFKTVTGTFNNKRLTVISTGIGTDNIDIVINELDALVNIDFALREKKPEHTQLKIIRIGTSGAIQEDIEVGSLLVSIQALGLDSLLHYYDSKSVRNLDLEEAFLLQTNWLLDRGRPYSVDASESLLNLFSSEEILTGITATNVGFYGPQGRILLASVNDSQFHDKLKNFRYGEKRITNLEMETSGIYGLCKLLGHQALSLNAILANRATGAFIEEPSEVIKRLIELALYTLTK